MAPTSNLRAFHLLFGAETLAGQLLAAHRLRIRRGQARRGAVLAQGVGEVTDLLGEEIRLMRDLELPAVPAIVVTTPNDVIFRMVWLAVSAT